MRKTIKFLTAIFIFIFIFVAAAYGKINKKIVLRAWHNITQAENFSEIPINFENDDEPNAYVAYDDEGNYSLHVTPGLMKILENESEIDLHPFAAAYKIAGGGIRNAVVWAIYEAARNKRPLSRDDLLHGVEREYQKMGKVFIPIG